MIDAPRPRPVVRRLTAGGAAFMLAASLGTTAIPAQAAPALERARADTTLGDWPGNPYGGYGPGQRFGGPDPRQPRGGYGWPRPFGQVGGTVGLEASDATTEQSRGVVQVSTVVEFGIGEGAGSGLVIDGEDGTVVTNHHVVEGSTEVEVTVTSTGETYIAEVLGSDAEHDVAVLRLEGAPTLTEVATDTAAVAVGDTITAVGDAGGDGGTLTAASGTVTDEDEPVTVTNADGSQTTIRNLVEVDADIISGHSGGALLDRDGEVVGMNVAASSGGPDITGYAIPIGRVLEIAEDIVAGEESATVSVGYDAFLGVQLAPGSGAATLVGVLEIGAAATVGLAAGDTVTAVGGVSTPSAAALSEAIATHEAGETVSIDWTDAQGASHTSDVTLGRAPIA
jgi:S1-C subfamily serine protease